MKAQALMKINESKLQVVSGAIRLIRWALKILMRLTTDSSTLLTWLASRNKWSPKILHLRIGSLPSILEDGQAMCIGFYDSIVTLDPNIQEN